MTLKERLEKQLEVLEKAQEQAIHDHNYEAFVKLSAQIVAVVACLAEI